MKIEVNLSTGTKGINMKERMKNRKWEAHEDVSNIQHTPIRKILQCTTGSARLFWPQQVSHTHSSSDSMHKTISRSSQKKIPAWR